MTGTVIGFDVRRNEGGGGVCIGWCVCLPGAVAVEQGLLEVDINQPLSGHAEADILKLLNSVHSVAIGGGRLVTEDTDAVLSVLTEFAHCVDWGMTLPPMSVLQAPCESLARYHDMREHALHIAQAASFNGSKQRWRAKRKRDQFTLHV